MYPTNSTYHHHSSSSPMNGNRNNVPTHGGTGPPSVINNTTINVSTSAIYVLQTPGNFNITARHEQPLPNDSQRQQHHHHHYYHAQMNNGNREQFQQLRQPNQHSSMGTGSGSGNNARMDGSMDGSSSFFPRTQQRAAPGQVSMNRRFDPGATQHRFSSPHSTMTSQTPTPSTPIATPLSPQLRYDGQYVDDEELLIPVDDEPFVVSQ